MTTPTAIQTAPYMQLFSQASMVLKEIIETWMMSMLLMLEKVLPQPIDNTYRGSKIALWLFGLVVGVRVIQSLSVIFNGHETAISADGIPVDSFTPEAAKIAVALFAQGSLWRLTFCLICLLVLVRYKSAIPLMFALLVLNYLAAQLIYKFVPLERTGTPPGPIVNLGLFVLSAAGLALSLRSRHNSIQGQSVF